jgi:hypothetical protein
LTWKKYYMAENAFIMHIISIQWHVIWHLEKAIEQTIRDWKMSKSDYYVTLCNIFVFILWHVIDNSTFFLLAKTWSQKSKTLLQICLMYRQRQKIIVRNQLVYSICLKCIPSLVTKCWCLCQSHKEVIESNMQVTFWVTLHI